MTDRGRPGALVLGASRGLGFLLARELGDRGYDLAVCARSSEGLDAVRPELEATGARVLALPADLSVRAEAEGCVDRAVAELGGLDVVVANAGIIQVGPVESLTVEDVAGAQDAIFWATVVPVLRAVEAMRERLTGGRVIIIGSVAGMVPSPHLLPYTAAKYGVTGFAEALRSEVAHRGVSVTLALPGLMRTGSPRNALVAGDRDAEFRWFTLLDSVPVLSMDAARAARRIVRAGLAGRGVVVLTPLAKIGIRVHGLAPALVTRSLILLDRLLPAAPSSSAPPEPGHTLGSQPSWWRTLTRLTERAAGRLHEHDDETPVGRR